MSIVRTLTTTAATIGFVALASLNPTHAHATPGQYTRGGNVLVVVATTGCATTTWPKGTETTVCGTDSTVQHSIVSGDTFGVSIRSYSGYSVSCTVTDTTTGDLIWSDTAVGGATANCVRTAR